MNCLTGQGEESQLSSTEMEQLIQNVRTMRQGMSHCVVPATQSSPLAFPSPFRSWKSPTLTRMAPSTSLSSSTSSPALRTLPGTVSAAAQLISTAITVLALGQSSQWLQDKATL